MRYDTSMIHLPLPPEVEASVRAFAESTQRDVQSVIQDWVLDRLAAEQKRAFDRELLENDAAIDRGEYVTEEESIARVEAIERGE